MKHILILILSLASFAGYSQTVGQFRYDTTKFLKIGGRNHVMIENLIQTSDSTVKPLVVGADGVIKRNSYWPGGSGGGSGSIEYILQGYGIKIDSTGRLYTINIDSAEIENIIAGGDTTIFETVLDSTGQANNRILFSRNRKISSSPRLLVDSANSKIVINNTNSSAGGAATKLFVGGNAIITGQATVQSIPTSNDTSTYKMMVVGTDGVLRKRTYYPPDTYYPSLNLASNYILALNDTTIYLDSSLVVTSVVGLTDSTFRVTKGDGTTNDVQIKGGANTGGTGGTPAGSNGEIQFNNSGAFGATPDLHWDNTNDRLGIGINSPLHAIDIYKNSNSMQRVFTKNANSGSSAGMLYDVRNDIGGSAQLGVFSSTYSSGDASEGAKSAFVSAYLAPLHFAISPGYKFKWFQGGLHRMSLFTNGSLGIGTDVDSSALLVVNGQILASTSATVAPLILRNPSSTSYTSFRLYNDQNSGARALQAGYSGSAYSGSIIDGAPAGEVGYISTGAYPLVFGTDFITRLAISSAGAIRFNAYTAGTITADGSGNLTSSSDRRIKNSIKPFKAGLAEILRLRPSTFIYNADSTNTVMHGFIAQDVQKVIPGAVHAAKNGTLSLETNAIIAALVTGMQEQQEQIEELKAEIKSLKK